MGAFSQNKPKLLVKLSIFFHNEIITRPCFSGNAKKSFFQEFKRS